MLIDDDKDDQTVDTGSDEEVEVEVEVEDTSSNDDKSEKTASSDKKDDDDELASYSEGVKKRISKLTYKTREAERREAEALEYARAVKIELDTIKKRETSISKSFEAEAEVRLKTQEQLLRDKLRSAVDMGDVDKQVEAQTDLARLNSERERLSNFKAYRQQQVEEEARTQERERVQTQQRTQVQRPDPRAEDWGQRNSWFGTDQIMTQAAMTLHNNIVSEGFNPTSDDYYRELDTRIRREFPHKFASQKKPTTTVASGRPGQVKKISGNIELSDTQKTIAKRLGVSYDDYKRQLKLVQERAD